MILATLSANLLWSAPAVSGQPAILPTRVPPTDPLVPAAFFSSENNTYQIITGPTTARFTARGVVIAAGDNVLTSEFIGANDKVQLTGSDLLPAITHIYNGNDTANWKENLPMYAAITYNKLYSGIDLRYTVEGGLLKSEFIIQPGGDPADILIRYTGSLQLSLDDDQNLRIVLSNGEQITEQLPTAYQISPDGQQHLVAASFRLVGDDAYGFTIAGWDPTQPLIIDPLLLYATYLGGTDIDEGWDIAVDGDGNTLITGITHSTDFLVSATEIRHYQGGIGKDVFVSKFSPHGDLLYTTFIGGEGTYTGEEGNAIATDAQGNAYIAGETYSADFPILNAWQPQFGGYEDAYLLKLNPHGALVYSTFLGGSGGEEVNDIVADSIGNVYLGGEVYSDDFPLVNPWSSAVYGRDEEDAFISIFNANGELVYSTYISAPQRDQVFRIAVDREGYVYGAGMTSSPDFPLVNPLQSNYGGDWDDGFIFKLDPWNNRMIYSTFLGGAGRDECWGLAVDDEGAAYVTGFTISPNFPVVNAFQNQFKGNEEVFVAKLSPSGNQLRFSTFVGGAGRDQGWGLALDGANNIYVTGETASPDFPTLNALQPYQGEHDAFVLVMTADGVLQYSSFLGGSGSERGWRISVDENWIAHITGETDSTNFPLKNAAQNQLGGQRDAFVASYGLIPTPTPTPTPTPVPTPTPFASTEVGAEGALLWISSPGHITMLKIPGDAVAPHSVITLTYDNRANTQGELQGNDHFFSITGNTRDEMFTLPITQFIQPAQLILGYNEQMPIISNTLALYRLSASGWTTENITKVTQAADYLIADIQWLGVYGLLGKTNRVYLPVIMRQ